jgi:hypothetical protein
VDFVGNGTRYDLTLTNLSQCPAPGTIISIGSNTTGYIAGLCDHQDADPDLPIVLEVTHNNGTLIVLANQTSGVLISGGVFSACQYNVMGVLPIELSSFEGKALEKSNLLTWQTKSESQNKGFDIEASPNPSKGGEPDEWQKIGFVPDHGTTNEVQRYSFSHVLPSFGGAGGGFYYRLKQLDFDGRFEYSKIISITQKGGNTVSVYPNPSKGVLNISATDYEQAFVLVNSIGQIVKQGEQLEETIKSMQNSTGNFPNEYVCLTEKANTQDWIDFSYDLERFFDMKFVKAEPVI